MLSSSIGSILVFLSLLGIASAAQPTVFPTKAPSAWPSIAPSESPTVAPTVVPTQFPTKSAPGWLNVEFYDQDELGLVIGRRTNVCMPYMGQVESNSDVTLNFMFNCGDEVAKIWLYGGSDTDCTTRIYEMLIHPETEILHGETVQFGNTTFYDFTRIHYACSQDDSPYTFFPPTVFNESDNSTSVAYFATELGFPESADNESTCASTSDSTLFVSYRHDFCFKYRNADEIDYSAKFTNYFTTVYMPSENIWFKKYEGDSCYDWNETPVMTEVIEINMCEELHVYNDDTNLTVNGSMNSHASESFGITAYTKTPLDRLAFQAYKEMTVSSKVISPSVEKEAEQFFYSNVYYADDGLNIGKYASYSMWLNTPSFPDPTTVPTHRPTHPTYRPTPEPGEPTAAPTVQQVYEFSGMMTLSSIDQSQWYAKDSNSESFIQAVAANMGSMNPDDFTLNEVRNYHPADRKLRTLSDDEEKIVVADFTVKFILASVNYDNIETAYDELTSNVIEGVYVTGLFDSLLQGYSAENGGSLDNVKSIDVTFTNYTASSLTSIPHDDSTHSGIIVGMVVGVGVGLACIAGMYWWVFHASN